MDSDCASPGDSDKALQAVLALESENRRRTARRGLITNRGVGAQWVAPEKGGGVAIPEFPRP